MSERLTVYFAGQMVGTLWSTESGQMQFQYSESWREARRASPSPACIRILWMEWRP